MRVSSSSSVPSSVMDDVPVDDQIDVELMSKDLDEQRLEGSQAVQMIEAAGIGINMPLSSGPIGRRINIKI